MTLHLIDMEKWPRRQHFHHYLQEARCTYSLTVQLDITELRRRLKERGYKAYAAQIYMLATQVNRFPEFRCSLDDRGRLGYWDEVWPNYTVFHPASETFFSLWTPFSSVFRSFHEAYLADIAACQGDASGLGFSPKGAEPANSFSVSSLPWLDFSAFNLNLYTEGRYLLPIFTFGRYSEQDGRTLLPLAIQVHHAVCDGFHVGRFVEELQKMADACSEWLN